MDSAHQRQARLFLEAWDQSSIDGAKLLAAVRKVCPGCSDEDLLAACEAVARGPRTAASCCAAAALCRLVGLGDPLDTVYQLIRESGRTLTEPQWFAWIAGYSYNWICNSGLSACYFGFDDRQFADRIRVYESIGAGTAAQVLREADAAFGPGGPAPTLAGRQAAISDELDRRLEELNPRFWACDDEIFTCILLYTLEHPADFRVVAAS